MINKKLFSFLIPSILLVAFCATTLAATANVILPTANKQCNIDCVKHIQNIIDKYRDAANIPGIQLTVSFPKQPMQVFCSGTLSKNGNVPVIASTKFEIGNTTKSFTAAIALQLEEQVILQRRRCRKILRFTRTSSAMVRRGFQQEWRSVNL
ncbi:MAG: serine hydrolase [Gammaproteobacteria bacterium]|nr:serine hydrolase [Gammaproteobacteria bacterium]